MLTRAQGRSTDPPAAPRSASVDRAPMGLSNISAAASVAQDSQRWIERLQTNGAERDMTAPAFPDRDRLLAALTGPRGPELADADADTAIPGMRAHFEGCSACAEDRDSLRALLISEAGQPS